MIQTPVRPRQTDGYWEKFDQFQQSRAGQEVPWLSALRKTGIARFAETGYPTVQDEDWRFTNVAPIAKLPFLPVMAPNVGAAEQSWLSGLIFEHLQGYRLVFVDGHYAPDLSRVTTAAAGILVMTMAAALEQQPALLERYLNRSAPEGHNPFASLNTAFFTDGVLIYLPDNARLQEPVQILHISTSTDAGATCHLRHLIVAGANSQVTVVENYVGRGAAPTVTNVTTDLFVGAGSNVEHCKFQDESEGAFHMAALHADLGRNCNFLAHSFALGGRLSRNNIRTLLGGEGIECILNGLYLTRNEQLADHHMIVEHAQPHCNSHEYFNGILDGRSRGVFHGRILVRQAAQKTDAKQTNKNLLLSDDAGATTKPQLEIYADDVKCTHGATIGQLNQESIFYLRARGIGQETARRMLMHAFAGEIIDRISSEPVREELDQLVWNRLEQNKLISVQS